MVELQSCAAGLVNASALCGIEQEVKAADSSTTINVIAEISAELRREREKNAELMERISFLEAQIQRRDKESFLINQHDICLSATERDLKMFKRQKTGTIFKGSEDGNVIHCEIASLTKHDTQCAPSNEVNLENQLVNWINMDETQLLHVDKLKDDDFSVECDDTDDSEEEEDHEEADTSVHPENIEIYLNPNQLDDHRHPHCASHVNQLKIHQDDGKGGIKMPCLGSFYGGQNERKSACINEETNEGIKKVCTLLDTEPAHNRKELRKADEKETERIEGNKTTACDPYSAETASHEGFGSMSYVRQTPKVAFCPKEVKRILESEVLLLKNAQSHTIRKIIVFASLGIRHGCDEMYELDFNHFSILRKGEPYVSPKDPGEHVLYENPGVRRKIFYPNWQNPTLCPVRILEEEKAMRPSDASCPSCLFLCIKYGGRTRNLPQNEYVRQRMGRNKLKSFGPVMCRMAMLVHMRCGSFFFKALGITLLFMAGFPDDLVQRETKYRSLDLLQKYYRTDKDTEGENLFLPHPRTCDTASPGSEKIIRKTTSKRSKSKKQANSRNKPPSLPRSSVHHSAQSNSSPATQFGLMGYDSLQTNSVAAFKTMPCQTPTASPQVPNQVTKNTGIDISYHNNTPFHLLPTQPGNAFVPMIYWSTSNAFPPPCTSAYGYRPFPSTANYISMHPQPYFSYPPYSSQIPKMAANNGNNDMTLDEADSDSDSSSSSTEPKEALATSK